MYHASVCSYSLAFVADDFVDTNAHSSDDVFDCEKLIAKVERISVFFERYERVEPSPPSSPASVNTTISPVFVFFFIPESKNAVAPKRNSSVPSYRIFSTISFRRPKF